MLVVASLQAPRDTNLASRHNEGHGRGKGFHLHPPNTILKEKKAASIKRPFTVYAMLSEPPLLCRNHRIYTNGVDASQNKNTAPACTRQFCT